jgi:hypothetical protein
MNELKAQPTKNECELTDVERAVYQNYLLYCQRIGARPASVAEYFRITGKF